MDVSNLLNKFENEMCDVPRFEKVSFDQFKEDWIGTFEEYDYSAEDIEEIKSIYDGIELPTRSTVYSAGYDFKSPINFYLKPGQSIMIPTGIRCAMPTDMVLMIYPRSSLATKYRLIPMNLTAVIDSDYYDSDNEGHVFMKLVNDGDKNVSIEEGRAFCQGILMKYFTTINDIAGGIRNGGMGSTDKQ